MIRATRHEVSLKYNYRRVININTYLGSLSIVEVRAAMVPSPLLKSGQIRQPASLVVLTDCGAGVDPSCEEDRATQVDSTGPTTINMLTIYIYIYLNSLLLIRIF